MKLRGFVIALVAIVVASVTATFGQSDRLNADNFKPLAFRSLGPSLMSGRVADVAVDPKDPSVVYVATGAGGLWKSVNRGVNFEPIFDQGGSFSLATIVVDPKNSQVLWLGTGENSNPRAAMYGDGVYKSTDAGKTWNRVGLESSEHIGNIIIDPRNSDVVYVAAQGALWSAGGDRGVYKTTDGGKTWKAVLTVSPDTGANEIAMDPNNPDVLFAFMWQRRRSTGQFVGGGPESGLYKTTNGGNAWTKLANGLPKGAMGRASIAVDGKVRPTRVYALINARTTATASADESGFYRSDDAGNTFKRMQPDPPPAPASAPAAGAAASAGTPAAAAPAPQGRGGRATGPYTGGDPGYYHEIFVDPVRPDTIWSVNTNLERSDDGGKTWRGVGQFMPGIGRDNVHVDYHDVWVDPTDKRHMIFGNDGGAYETWDEGQRFRHFVLPITQFYRVGVDNVSPFYRVCGGAQDNSSMCGPSRTPHEAGIRVSDWYMVGGGDGFQSRVDPQDPNIIYSQWQQGAFERLDLRTNVRKSIRPRVGGPPAGGAPAGGGAGGGRGGGERANWDVPYIISPHSPTRLYWATNFVYRSEDRGDTWTRISGDISRNLNPAEVPIMGKLWDPATTVSWNNATTPLSNAVSLDESPLLEGLVYVGTDDGLLQVTEDGGANWRKVDKFPGVPDNTYVSDIAPSPRDANVVFVALNNWQRGDYTPYLLRSDDRGKTFTSIVGNLPKTRANVWTVEQDHVNPNLLFAGTEFALYFTVDGGKAWTRLAGGLPTAQIRDMAIQRRESDLVLGTFGRGFYVLDDYSALREVSADTLAQEAYLFPLRRAWLYSPFNYESAAWGNDTTPNPPVGAMLSYNIGTAPSGADKYVITITDDTGKQVRRITPDQTAGFHRVNWANFCTDGVAGAPAGGRGFGGGGGGGCGGGLGPAITQPGRYTATLGKLVGETVTPVGKPQTFMVQALPPHSK